MKTATTHERVFKGWHMLAMMVGFFGVVIAVNITMAVLATTSWTGLLAKNGYTASIDYAHIEAAREKIAGRGWQIALGAPEGIVTLRARDSHGEPLPHDLAATATPLSRRSDPVRLVLTEADGTAHANEALPQGRWMLALNVGTGKDALLWRAVVDVDQ